MEQDAINFSIQIKEKDLFHFLMRHFYGSFSGIIGVIISLAALALFAFGLIRGDMFDGTQQAMLFILASLFTIIQPLQLMVKAKGQVKRSPVKDKPLCYEVSGEGIYIRQEEEQATLPWEEIRRLVETPKAFFIYISSVNANILPKDQMNGLETAFRKEALLHMDRGALKVKAQRE